MAAPPNFEEGQSTYRPLRFNGQYYGWWKTLMHDFMMAEDSELWDIICNSPLVPMKKLEETGPLVPKGRREYSDIDRNAVEKNYRAKKILMCGIRPDEYSRVSTCDTAKEKLEALQIAHEGTTQAYEMKRKKDNERKEPKKEKNLVLKAESSDSSDEDSDMAYLTKRFQKILRRNGGIPNWGSQAFAAWGDSSSESEQELDAENSSMMVVETEAMKYDSLFTLMAQSNDDEEEDEDDEVNSRDVQRNLKSYSSKNLSSLSNVLIDAYYSLINDKEILTIELGEAQQSRDDLVVCVVDLNEAIANLEKEKEALNERITSIENERDNLMVVVVDLKETIEGLNNEKHTLEEKVASTEEERDDLNSERKRTVMDYGQWMLKARN
ncbi:uncharacterized protein [Nicotiana sylvestris]|uniref:uncharacterized protein n=1 Tax=Nicotiana sylvestris TaxID=4096 RepID=UPI00388CA7F5